MNSKTEQFKWQNRVQAANDLLQVVYHSPPYISQIALQLLQAIRSPHIVPELVAIACDESRPIEQRWYTLQAIAQIDGDIYVPELEQVIKDVLAEDTKSYRNNETKVTPLYTNLLDRVRLLVERHPSNCAWFFETLSTADEPVVAQSYIEKWLSICLLKDDFRNQLAKQLLQFVDQDRHLLTIDTIFRLWRDHEEGREWLNRHFDDVLQLCITSDRMHVKHLAKRWNRLHIALLDQLPDFTLPDTKTNEDSRVEEDTSHLLESPAFQYLNEQYENAVSDNIQGYLRLQHASFQANALPGWKATATYFIGKLIPKYNSIKQLTYLLEKRNGDGRTMIGIRIEAGEALLNIPTPETWQTMINSFFIEPRTISGDYLLKWISYLTDFLSGEDIELPSTYRSLERRSWVKELSEISNIELKELIGG